MIIITGVLICIWLVWFVSTAPRFSSPQKPEPRLITVNMGKYSTQVYEDEGIETATAILEYLNRKATSEGTYITTHHVWDYKENTCLVCKHTLAAIHSGKMTCKDAQTHGL